MNPVESPPEIDELVRSPRQDRSRKTLNRIVNAALALIEEKGVDGASVQDITRRARASVGSFYARFRGKEDLLRYLEIQLWTDAGDSWAAALDEHDWNALTFEELVATLVGVLVQVHRAGARQRRILESRRGPESSSAAARSFDRKLGADIRELLLRHEERIDRPDPGRAVDLCVATVRGTLRLRDTDSLHAASLEELDDEGWEKALAGLCLAYLTNGAAAPSEGGQMDFFEIWG
ncbi:TetR/AcrR family transcriptional regulator [Gaopeijia maritima]|uniref:TetR/AcrR family transcriptional regulator n=1 Tax=Gaopeijia maritima TaxID=3119007 RepID=UPI00386F6672